MKTVKENTNWMKSFPQSAGDESLTEKIGGFLWQATKQYRRNSVKYVNYNKKNLAISSIDAA